MAEVRFHKVSALPAVESLETNALYFVQNGTYAEAWLTSDDDDPVVAHAIGNTGMIEAIAGALAGGGGFVLADDITDRDSLTAGATPFLVLVLDATDDPTVDAGAAMYAWVPGSPGEYVKVAEYESMDLDITPQWATTAW